MWQCMQKFTLKVLGKYCKVNGNTHCTHWPIFRGFAAESVDSIPESADSTIDFVIVGRLPVLNMFNISTPIKSADSSRPTFAIDGLHIGLVGMGL